MGHLTIQLRRSAPTKITQMPLQVAPRCFDKSHPGDPCRARSARLHIPGGIADRTAAFSGGPIDTSPASSTTSPIGPGRRHGVGTEPATAPVCSGPVRRRRPGRCRVDGLVPTMCQPPSERRHPAASPAVASMSPARSASAAATATPAPTASLTRCRLSGPIGTIWAVRGRNRLRKAVFDPCAHCVTAIKNGSQGYEPLTSGNRVS